MIRDQASGACDRSKNEGLLMIQHNHLVAAFQVTGIA